MEKHFIAMVTEEESESDLYYVDDDYSIQRIKNNMTPEVYDKETLEDAKERLKSLVHLNKTLSEAYRVNDETIDALKTAIITINDILMLYNNN